MTNSDVMQCTHSHQTMHQSAINSIYAFVGNRGCVAVRCMYRFVQRLPHGKLKPCLGSNRIRKSDP
jgi:hypothetical protein